MPPWWTKKFPVNLIRQKKKKIKEKKTIKFGMNSSKGWNGVKINKYENRGKDPLKYLPSKPKTKWKSDVYWKRGWYWEGNWKEKFDNNLHFKEMFISYRITL